MIFVCNPNNQTSTVVDPEELARFVAAVPNDILVVIDEAYVEYIRDGLVPDSSALARAHRNVVVLRTFSKAYGLAGLLVGYAVGDPEAAVMFHRPRIVGISLRMVRRGFRHVHQHAWHVAPGKIERQIHAHGPAANDHDGCFGHRCSVLWRRPEKIPPARG